MLRLIPALLLLCLTSCASIYRALAGESRIAPVREAGAKKLICDIAKVTVDERDYSHEMQFVVTGCGRAVACHDIDDAWLCFPNPPRIADFGEERLPEGFKAAADSVAAITGCPAGETRVSVLEAGRSWSAALCDRDFICTASCEESAASVERTAEKVSSDRLALETGCAAEEIKLENKAKWIRGSERAYSFSACGKRYTCTTAAGRTDCKAALDVTTAPSVP